MEKAYYREYYELERSHWWFRARAEILLGHLERVLPERRSLKILNIGAATGRSSELLARLGHVTSSEYSGECCAFTRAQTGLDLMQASITALPFEDNLFDLVCAFDVIEHVEDDRTAVTEMCRVCRPGGMVCVTVPAFMFLWSQHDDVNHHCRRYTGAQLRGLISSHGLKSVFHSYFNFWLFFPIAALRLLAVVLPKRKREDAGSDFFSMRNVILDKIFYFVFRSEALLLFSGFRFPVGVSILSSSRKSDAARG